jgi:hypothetical protein
MNAIYLAIFLHMARKILRKVNTPKPRVRVKTVNGRKLFQADPDRVHDAARKIRSSYSEEQMCSMVGYDVEALLKESLQQEMQVGAWKRPSLGKIFEDCARPIVITQDDIDSGRVRQILLRRELNAFSQREPGYTLASPRVDQASPSVELPT